MKKFRHTLVAATFLLAMGGFQAVSAATVTVTLGNDAPGFSDGDTPTIIQLIGAQGGQPAPFDAGKGNEVLGPDFDESWTFNYAPIDPANVITMATLTIGIADHDSAADGSQLATLLVDGNDFSAAMDAEFESRGGADMEYNVYSIDLSGGTILDDLFDGAAVVDLALQGPGLQTNLLLGGVSESPNNGAHLIFSTLELDVQVVPIPAALPLFASALVLLGLYRRRIQRNAA